MYNDMFLSVDLMLVMLFKLFTLDGWLKLYKDMIRVGIINLIKCSSF